MKTLSIFLSCLLLPLAIQAQKVITVDNRPNTGADYTSLSSAVGAATVGDTIQIHPSATSYGNISFNKRLILVGLSHNPANSKVGERAYLGTITLQGSAANTLITGLELNIVNTSAVTDISNVRIVNNKINNYVVGNSGGNIDNWTIEGNIFVNAYVNSNGSEMWITKNNIFDNTNSYAIQSYNDQCSFLNNIVISSSGNFANNSVSPIVNNNVIILEGNTVDVKLNGTSTIVFNNNLTYNTSALTVTALSGSNNLDNTDPGFSFAFGDIADYYNNDYNVSGAAVNAGTDGTDLGVYGAMFNFDPQGRPDDWPYMTSLDISNSSVPQGQNIDVTFTAEKKN
ncbi:MAG TPA: hypothetical protein VJ945_04355 [Flavobacteriaceae bacterium]|nr:hypothetical protein [Flavobacteriaceae bacterium]